MKKTTFFETLLLGILVISSGLVSQVNAAAQINLLTHSGWLDLTGYYHVTGEVENAGDSAAHFIKITATFYDLGGTVVTTSFQYTALEVLLPGRKSPYEILLFNTTRSAKVHHYSLDVTFSASDSLPTGLEIVSDSSNTDATGYLHVTGEIENSGSQTATYVVAIATFYNSSGNVVAVSFAPLNPRDINSGQKGIFDIVLGYTNRVPLVASYALTANSQQYTIVPEFSTVALLLTFLTLTLCASVFALKIRRRKLKPPAV